MMGKMKRRLMALTLMLGLLLFVSPGWGGETHIRIFHVNDFHGFAEPYRPVDEKNDLGGVAYLAQRISKLRAEPGVHTLLLAAGDMIQGHPWANLNNGRASIEVMNHMGFAALALGNHEFDFGVPELEKRIGEATFPVLGANVEGVKGVSPYVIYKLGDVRVAVVGLITPDTPFHTHPRNVGGITFGDSVAPCQRYLSALKGQADVFVLLTHLGHGEDRRLATACPGAHVIIGGHSHTRVEEPPVVNGTLVCQAWEHAKGLGIVDIVVEGGKIKSINGRLEIISPRIGPPDQGVAAIVDRYTSALNAAQLEVIGRTKVPLIATNSRQGETNLGNLIADVVREKTGADMALINGGSIRMDIPAGEIRVKDLYGVLPFPSFAVVVRIKGKEVRRAIEHGVSGLEENSGAFPQVSGVSYTFDPYAPSGFRVKRVKGKDGELNEEAFYTVAINDFMAAGGDGYTMLSQAVATDTTERGEMIRDMVAAYIRERGVIAPALEGRITAIGDRPCVR